jgi:hypothetical protein
VGGLHVLRRHDKMVAAILGKIDVLARLQPDKV